MSFANLSATWLFATTLERATLRETRLANTDLHDALGLATVIHEGNSSIGIDTSFRSGGLPEDFPPWLRRPGRIHLLRRLAHRQTHRVLLLLHQLLQRRRRVRPSPPRSIARLQDPHMVRSRGPEDRRSLPLAHRRIDSRVHHDHPFGGLSVGRGTRENASVRPTPSAAIPHPTLPPAPIRTISLTFAGSAGFNRWWSKPAARAFSRSSAWP